MPRYVIEEELQLQENIFLILDFSSLGTLSVKAKHLFVWTL